ncbi:hypothetical protein [Amycolatopsis sp.]|uniref:hypothetical protein n=1 Tax=Amycolatopsis sp. TaxID=37632 RepID=UPI002D7E6599|nr:hypothetical protein [Amycolatopsis sp.]HET6703985.1 hypothetical protein [Amycolatopsis sp.]
MTGPGSTRSAFRHIGVTDECVDCQRPGCPQTNLRSTVVLMPLDADGNDVGEATYYGSTCAAMVLGVTGRGAGTKVLAAARGAALRTCAAAEDARRMLAFYGLLETGAVPEEALVLAAERYRVQHRRAHWAPSLTRHDWEGLVVDMVLRKRAALADARALRLPAS